MIEVARTSDSTAPTQPAGDQPARYLILMVLVVLCCYYPSFAGTFVLDDSAWISQNRAIGDTPTFRDLVASRSVSTLSLKVNYWVDGLNPRGYHAVNLMIHLLAGFALFGVVRRTLLLPSTNATFQKNANELAAILALLWMIHPLQTQSVTYTIQRAESLMGFFFIMTLYCMIRGNESATRWRWYGLNILCFTLGLWTKEVMVMVLPMLLLYDWTFLEGSLKSKLSQRWGLYLALGLIVGTFLAINVVGTATREGTSAGFGVRLYTPWQYALIQLGVVVHYIKLSLWPTAMCFDYFDWPTATTYQATLVPGSILLVLLAITVWGVFRKRWFGFVGAWFFLILAPTSSIMPIQDRVVEHRMYLPLAAVLTILVVGGASLFFALIEHRTELHTYRSSLCWVLVVFFGGTLGYLTLQRNMDYRSAQSLWLDTAQKRPNNFRAWTSLAEAQLGQGNVDGARKSVLRAFEITARYYSAHYVLGLIALHEGNLEQAEFSFRRAVELVSEASYLHHQLGFALFLQGKNEEAIEELETAMELDPNQWEAYIVRAVMYSKKDPEQCELLLKNSVELAPHWPTLYSGEARNIAMKEELKAGEYDVALFLSKAACLATNNEDPKMLLTRGMVFARIGLYDDAQQVISTAVQLPNIEKTTRIDIERKGAFFKAEKPWTLVEVLNAEPSFE